MTMERKIAFWAVGMVLGGLFAAVVQVVAGVVFAAQANATFAEFLNLFRGSNFAFNVAICAVVGVMVMESWRRRQSKAAGPAVARVSGQHGQRGA
ncbi:MULTISPECIES: hypothetical protein [Gammaproteobacteria]|uniref:hypothetical protein n=1 Tax=Gammaproteobacteria TaxID=1236 RepID=UPI0007C7CE62|nr:MULTISPECIES: hypothetical protein [Gammaproteobacteria]EAQ9154330.1 hypothetical protein [Salmonella enterica]EBS0352116.1 hypothetical protein [Salmonella enterica subsp. enterica serovar Java]EBW7170419.1 hypothetical protein [Salmonella enterica subsp. enterica serovar Javiana]ECB2918778.1 hypothetical protein [Salmonella enterica subsp. enterica serovar Minnesota]ECD7684177.1 hypothetical protein [Salmonella enterica subsp. enterica serovar Typhimurium]ECG5279048.1 hypothetical protei